MCPTKPHTPQVGNEAAVLGFVGAPFTLATYIVEGGSSKNFAAIKRLAFGEPAVLHALLDKLADNVADYVRYQVGFCVCFGGCGGDGNEGAEQQQRGKGRGSVEGD